MYHLYLLLHIYTNPPHTTFHPHPANRQMNQSGPVMEMDLQARDGHELADVGITSFIGSCIPTEVYVHSMLVRVITTFHSKTLMLGQFYLWDGDTESGCYDTYLLLYSQPSSFCLRPSPL